MILCVTGPMAAGKNAASDILQKKGFACVDADKLGHIAVENQKEKILATFGPMAENLGITLLDPEGKINRKALGALIFRDKKLIKMQEDIVYPEINALFDKFIEENRDKDLVINATVLYKVPLIKRVDLILYVDCPKIIRLLRASKRDHIPLKQILQRFKAQKNLFSKYREQNTDIVRVWNTGTRTVLEKKLGAILLHFGRG